MLVQICVSAARASFRLLASEGPTDSDHSPSASGDMLDLYFMSFRGGDYDIYDVHRESLEAALFDGIVAAATRDLHGRARWLGGGVAIGVFGAIAMALLLSAATTAQAKLKSPRICGEGDSPKMRHSGSQAWT